jgi:hypothetical protein
VLVLFVILSTAGPGLRWRLLDGPVIAQGSEVVNPATLKLRRPIWREISTQQTHPYIIPLDSRQYLRMTLDSSGTGLRLSLSDPAGKTLIQTPCSYADSIRLDLVTEHAGSYGLTTVGCGTEQYTGNYLTLVNETRLAVEADRDRAAASMVVLEADRLRSEHSIAADREAVEKYRMALQLWQSIKDDDGEAETLRDIGEMLQARGERPAALALFRQALTVIRRVRRPESEGRILNNIGYLQILMGDSQQGLETCARAQALSRTYDDRKTEASARSIAGEAYFDSGDLQKALAYQETALRLAQASREIRQQAQALLRTGYARVSLGDIPEALNAYQEALHRFRAVRDHQGEGLFLLHWVTFILVLAKNRRRLITTIRRHHCCSRWKIPSSTQSCQPGWVMFTLN